jgi:hypothetical protein
MKKIIHLIVTLGISVSLFSQRPSVPKANLTVTKKLSSLKMGQTALFTAANGKQYQVTIDSGELDLELPETNAMAKTANANVPCQGEKFDGADRKKAKTAIASADLQTYSTLTGLMSTFPPDETMGNHDPAISTGSDSKRVTEEIRNVWVCKAWIYTFSRESDEDYHVIIGNTAAYNPNTKFFNIEISGLPNPANSSSTKLSAARTSFKNFFRLTDCQTGYVNFGTPVEIEFKGSLFFDQLHWEHHQTIGHGNFTPNSYWEVHPVSYLKFH